MEKCKKNKRYKALQSTIKLFLIFSMAIFMLNFLNAGVLCYQEFANQTTACGGLDTGSYSYSSGWTNNPPTDVPTNIYDGSWTTTATPNLAGDNPTMSVTYYKPVGATNSSLWQVKDLGSGIRNLTILQSCWDYNANYINLKVQAHGAGTTDWLCQNATAYQILNTGGSLNVNEEAMEWNLGDIAPTVNLTSPSNNSVTLSNSITFNWSAQDDWMIQNISLFINGVRNYTYTNGITNVSNITISRNLPFGAYNWTCQAYDNFTTPFSFIATNYSFNVNRWQLDKENYSQTTTETSSERFLINISLFPGNTLISVNLSYNGTHYIVSDITSYGSSVELKKTIDILRNFNPYKNESKDFYWSFIFSDGSSLSSQITSTNSQQVLPLIINYCNSTYNLVSLNFTTYDELNPNPKINTTFHTSWSFWTGGGAVKKNYSFEDTTLGNSSFKFCIYPNWTTIYTDLNSEITSPLHFPRTYYLSNATINNITQEIPLRMINTSTGVKFFHTIRRSVERISNAIVIISKYDVGLGQWVVVGVRQSDDSGEFIEYLELDKDYTYSITQNGVFLGSLKKTSTCAASPCTIDLEISDGNVELWKGYYDVFAPNVVYNISYDRNTHNVTYTFIDTSGLATYFRLEVSKITANQTGALICNETLYATLGTLTCDLTGQSGQFVARGFVARSPEKFVAILYGVLDALAETIGKDEGLFFAFLIILVVGFAGIWNPVVGIILAGIAFIFSALMGLVMVSTTSMILIGIIVVILLIKMGKGGV